MKSSRPSLTLVLLLVAIQPAALHDPPSFPTRRSSDLIPSAPRYSPRPAAWVLRNCHAVSCRRLTPPPTARHRRQKTDRKSTRLNSSHLVISYAVFCLKKKHISKGQYKNTTTETNEETH